MNDKIELKEVLDLLDKWIGQNSGLQHLRFGYREEGGADVTIEVSRKGGPERSRE